MLEVTNIRNGAILNHARGTETDDYLEIKVEGIADPQAIVKVNGADVERADRFFSAPVRLTQKINEIVVSADSSFGEQQLRLTVLWDKKSFKRYNYYIDDCSFFYTDIAKQRPKSLFDHFFRRMRLAGLREGAFARPLACVAGKTPGQFYPSKTGRARRGILWSHRAQRTEIMVENLDLRCRTSKRGESERRGPRRKEPRCGNFWRRGHDWARSAQRRIETLESVGIAFEFFLVRGRLGTFRAKLAYGLLRIFAKGIELLFLDLAREALHLLLGLAFDAEERAPARERARLGARRLGEQVLLNDLPFPLEIVHARMIAREGAAGERIACATGSPCA